MPSKEPTIREIEESIVEVLREEEVLTLATLDAEGYPSASHMHFAADGLIVYMHTFVYTRKHAQIRNDHRVSFAVNYSGVNGFEDRFNSRSLQVKGHARVVSDADEIAHVANISRAKAGPGPESAVFDNVKPPDHAGQQLFLRIDPVEALWADHRIRLLWRVLLDFQDGHVVGARTYDSVTRPRS